MSYCNKTFWGSYFVAVVGFQESTDNAYVQADTTFISPRVGGEIKEVLVKNNQAVQAGQLLLRLDDADYQAKVANALSFTLHPVLGQQKLTLSSVFLNVCINCEACSAEPCIKAIVERAL